MKTRRIIFKLVLVMIMLVILPMAGYTEETQPAEQVQQEPTEQQREQPSQQGQNKGQGVHEANTGDSPKTGGSDAFDKGVAKMLSKAKKIENNTVALAQAYSFPLLKYSLIGGAVLLVVGMLLSVLHKKTGDGVRGAGLGLMFGGVIAFILMNFSPEIAEKIISFVQWFAS